MIWFHCVDINLTSFANSVCLPRSSIIQTRGLDSWVKTQRHHVLIFLTTRMRAISNTKIKAEKENSDRHHHHYPKQQYYSFLIS